jgi:phytoene dehydrogenase-like protein
VLTRCTTSGVTVELGTEAASIEASGGRVDGVRLAGGSVLPADVVVANADAATVYTRLWPDPRRARRSYPRSLSGFLILLGVRGRTPGIAHHTVTFPADYGAEFDALLRGTCSSTPRHTAPVGPVWTGGRLR